MRVYAIDPASGARDRGFAFAQDGRILAASGALLPPAYQSDFIVVEAQWFDKTAERRPENILKLARYAGRLQQAVAAVQPHAVPVVIPVQVWKAALFGPAFANAPKAVFSANLAQLPQLAPYAANHNVLDAAAIALACCKLGAAALARYKEKL